MGGLPESRIGSARLPGRRVRWSIRGLMLAVAIAATLLGAWSEIRSRIEADRRRQFPFLQTQAASARARRAALAGLTR